MILFLLVPLFFVLLGYFLSHLKWEKKVSIKFGVPLLIVSCMVGLAVYDYVKNYPIFIYEYELNINKEKLETLSIDLDSTQQYEAWFCPDERIVPNDDEIELYMHKTIWLRKYVSIYIRLYYYTDVQSAKRSYDRRIKHGSSHSYRDTKTVNANYEYSFSETQCGQTHNGFRYVPDGGYSSGVIIRYKNVIFEFSESSDQRESRIDEVIDLLWADYEQYKSNMEEHTVRTILFQGDSVTDCQRDRRDFDGLGGGYPLYVSQALPGVRVLNRGISGHRAKDLVARWQEDCLALEPDVVSILIGINDVWRRYDSNDPTTDAAFEASYRELLEPLRARNIKLVLILPFLLDVNAGVTRMREDLASKQAVVRRLAEEFGAQLLDADELFRQAIGTQGLPPSHFAEDGVHPTQAGHRLLAEAVTAILKNA